MPATTRRALSLYIVITVAFGAAIALSLQQGMTLEFGEENPQADAQYVDHLK